MIEITEYFKAFSELMDNWNKITHSQRMRMFDELSDLASRIKYKAFWSYQI